MNQWHIYEFCKQHPCLIHFNNRAQVKYVRQHMSGAKLGDIREGLAEFRLMMGREA